MSISSIKRNQLSPDKTKLWIDDVLSLSNESKKDLIKYINLLKLRDKEMHREGRK